jgi:hypothetical protein
MKNFINSNSHYVHYIALFISVVLFIIPFFWLKPGFVDLGGDSGRFFFIDPLSSVQNLISQENLNGVMQLSIAPYEYFLYLLKLIVGSSTYLIAVSNGLILSLGFLFSCLVIRELLSATGVREKWYRDIAAFTGGIIYISFISNAGWSQALSTQNQIFLNPLIFYLLIRFVLTSSMMYGLAILVITVIFSGNFGFSAMPQLMSFMPLALIFLFLYSRFISCVRFPLKKLVYLALLFTGLHAFHIFPLVASIFGKTTLSVYIFNSSSIESSGVKYFDANHIALGKVSWQLFAPSNWSSQNILALVVPIIALLGFTVKRSKLLLLTGIFFAITLFLDTANITQIGVKFYHALFYIPGFLMFRSFNDRWYYVYAFFYMLLFSFSFYALIKQWKVGIAILFSVIIIGITTYRIFPFLQGKALYAPLYQTDNVTSVLMLDPDMLDAIKFTKNLPQDGKILTVPLTFPYYQMAYGKQGGAYRGISLIPNLAGHQDYSGFWAFGQYEKSVFNALQQKDIGTFLSLLKQLEVKYIFRNSDTRIMDDFPGYPYVFPGMVYSSKDQLPIIKNQAAYDSLISQLPVKKIFEKGFYSIYEFIGSPSYPQTTVDPKFHPFFLIGRIVSVATTVMVIGCVCWFAINKRYEKKK